MDKLQKHCAEWKKVEPRGVHIELFHLHEFLEQAKWIISERNQKNGCFCDGDGWGLTEAQSIFLGDWNILYLNSGMGYVYVCICQNSLNCILKICAFYII